MRRYSRESFRKALSQALGKYLARCDPDHRESIGRLILQEAMKIAQQEAERKNEKESDEHEASRTDILPFFIFRRKRP